MNTAIRNKDLISNYLFIITLAVLILNDHVLKWEYSNALTGKLSDVAGLFLLHLLIVFLFPRTNKIAAIITALTFAFWKSPLSEPLIQFYNHLPLIPISRVVDYTDLAALAVLVASDYFIRHPDRLLRMSIERLHPTLLIIPCCLAFMATSPPTSYYLRPKGDILINEKFVVNMDSASLFKEMIRIGLQFEKDTTVHTPSYMPAFVIKDLIISKQDTIFEIHLQVMEHNGKSIVYLNSVNANGTNKLNDWRRLRSYTRFYRKQVIKYLVNPLGD